ncbi:MAG: hypothetical protein ACJ741_11105 [Pyrinomonadaceae bacterium]
MKKNKPVPNQEDIYRLLAEGNWAALLSFVWENPQIITTDPIIRHAIATCEAVFFSKLDAEADKESLVSTLESFHLLHTSGKYRLPDERFKAVTVELVKLWSDKSLAQAYQRARHFPDDEACRDVIARYEATLPKQVAHSQQGSIGVTENKNVAARDGRCTLFKSRQEKEFFEAVREAFPMYIVYPNVAVKSVVEFDSVRDALTHSQRDYYFKATIDCVVFDYHSDLYLPRYFYELDSPHHDTPERKAKDADKDAILAAAGQRLYRIRREGGSQTRGDFARLVRDLTEKDLAQE